MASQTFASFKELLVKKELSDPNPQREVRYDSLARIFRHVQADIILSNVQHFAAAEIAIIKKLLANEQIQDKHSKISAAELEKLVKKGCDGLSEKSKSLLCELLDADSKVAQKDNQRLEALAEKFHPKDASEELKELQLKIAELKSEIVDIEMTLMTLENDGQTATEFFKKSSNARERRRQLVIRFEKQIQGIERKLSRPSKS